MADRLRHVLRALNSPWAITPDGFETVCAIIDRRAAGVRLSDDEIRAIVDESRAEFADRHAAAGSGYNGSGGAVAVIPVYGTILPRPVLDISGGGGCSMTTLMDKVKAADADPTVSHILLDIDSPGGSAFLVPEAAQVIRDCTTPVTAIANPLCCSAAYYLASQADDFVATPSAMVGSIGVFARHVDFSGQLEQDGVKVTLVSAGDNKTNGNPYEPLTDAARAEIQDSVDGFYEDFVNAVAQGRRVNPQDVLDKFGQGKTFSAVAAAGVGMVDRVATFDDVVAGLLGTSSGNFGARATSGTKVAYALERDVVGVCGHAILLPDRVWLAQGYVWCSPECADKNEAPTIHATKEECAAIIAAARAERDKDSPATAEQHDGADKTVTFAKDAEKLLARGIPLLAPDSTGR